MDGKDPNSQSKGSQENKAFIGGLNLESTVESLKDYFSKFGELSDAVVMKDPHTKRSRGFGFVSFTSAEAFDACLAGRPHEIDGREVEVKRAIPREESAPVARTHTSGTARTKKVFLGGLTLDTEEDEVRDVLSQFGTVVSVQIMTDKHTNKPRGFGFALFEDFEAVDKCCEKNFVQIRDRNVEVKKAVPQEDMRRSDPYRGGSGGGGGGGGGRYPRGGDSYNRDPYANYGRAMGGYGGMGGYDYSRYQSAEYPRYPSTADPYMAYQAAAGYTDRSAAAGYPGYPTGYRGGYDMSAYAGMYGGTASVGTYQQQTASNYGPARFGDVSKDRGAKSAQFHPYRR